MRGAAVARIALILQVLALQVVACAAMAKPWDDCNALSGQPNAQAYCQGLAAADQAIAEARWDDAIAMLGALSAAEIDASTPNYRPLLLLGIAHCGKGDRPTGIRYLSLYACALRLDYGAMSCWIDADPEKGLRPDLPPTCTAIMCGKGYSRGDPRELPQMIREFDEMRRRCN